MASVDAAMAERPHNIDSKNVDSKRAVPREVKNLLNLVFPQCYFCI